MNTKTKLTFLFGCFLFLFVGCIQIGEMDIYAAHASDDIQSIHIDDSSCRLIVKGNSDQRIYDFSKGVSIGMEENLLGLCVIENKSESEMKIFPVLNFSSINRPSEKEGLVALESFVLAPGQRIEKAFEVLPEKKKPSVHYMVELFFMNEQKKVVSNKAFFGYSIDKIISGIKNVVSDKTFYQKGETAKVSFEYVGGTDEGEADVRLNFKDENGNDCAITWEKQLTKENFGLINLEIIMEKECKGLRVESGIKRKGEKEWTQSGKDLLSKSQISHKLKAESKNEPVVKVAKESLPKKILFILMVVIPILLLLAYYIKRKIDARKVILIFLFFFLLSAGFLIGNLSEAACQIPNTNTYVKDGAQATYKPSPPSSWGNWWLWYATCQADGSIAVSVSFGWPHGFNAGCGIANGNGSCTNLVGAGPDIYYYSYSKSSSEAMAWSGKQYACSENYCGGEGWPPACCEYVCGTERCTYDIVNEWGFCCADSKCYSVGQTYPSCQNVEVPCCKVTPVSGTLSCPNGFMVYTRTSGYAYSGYAYNCDYSSSGWELQTSCTPRCLTFPDSQIISCENKDGCTKNGGYCDGTFYKTCGDSDGDSCYEQTGSTNCLDLGPNYSCTSTGCVCTPTNPNCAANTCTGKTCNDGCENKAGEKDCSLKIDSYKEVAP